LAAGPFTLVREWELGRDTIAHEYTDTGLLQNVEYFYRVTAYDDGGPKWEVPSMESTAPVIRAVPTAEPAAASDLSDVRVVPNPYIVEHAAQRSYEHPRLYFNGLPERCTIRIYTAALDLVATISHEGGSAAEWDLRTQGGQQAGSQMFLALIETPEGTSVVRKFSVIIAE
jgi:hypothetical protein